MSSHATHAVARIWRHATCSSGQPEAGLEAPLTGVVRGWWDRKGTEIDVFAEQAGEGRVRPGSLDGHIERLCKTPPALRHHEVERIAMAPALTPDHRHAMEAAGYLPQDQFDLLEGLLTR